MNETTTINEPPAIELLDRRAEDYALNRESLAADLREMEAQLNAVRDHFLPALKQSAAATSASKAALEAAIAANSGLFKSPRTMELHGIKFGYKMSKGKIEPGPNTVALIRKNLPEKEETLIKIKEELIKGPLKDLSAGERQSIGCRLVGVGDQLIIKSTTDAIDKVIDKILEDAGTVDGDEKPLSVADA